MLSDTKIRKALPKPRPYRLTDGGGLYVLLTTAGGRLWRYKYRFEGKEKLMSFGGYPDVPLSLARERHAAARRLLATGIDPMAQRAAERSGDGEGTTFQVIAKLWHDHWKDNKSTQHVDAVWNRLETYSFPLIGERPITEIEAPELVAMVKAIEAGDVADLPKRVLQTCGQVFRYGIGHGHCKRNPAVDFKPGDVLKPTDKTNLARVSEAQLPKLLRDIEVYRGSTVTRLAVKLMALTWPRTKELIGGRWEEINWEGRRWDIPKTRMKKKRPHIIPLSTQAIEVLRLLQIVTGSGEYMFPGEQDAATMSNNTILGALYRMGYKDDMTGHGFRGVASTILHEQGYDHNHIELQLAHVKKDQVSAAYDHALYLEPRRAMMQAWGDYLEGKLRGKA